MKGLAVAAVLALATNACSGQPARRALSGDLARPVAQYTGVQFAALVAPLRYGQGAERPRQCRGLAECTAGRRVNVRVDPVADADSLGPANLPQFGVIAARVRNLGAEMEGRYNMRGGAQYEYFLIVQPGAGGTATWVLEELDTQGTNVAHRSVASGRFVPCNHPFVRGARADFRTCAQPGGGRAGIQLISLEKQALEDPPLWLACALGCCTAET